ncbi:chromosomal replication initiator protein DnaA [Candidatus Parcubacteria bacterium]|nr:chromosomal replication initiator protein DnaA [Candidatus Parcubacteria bacterium]
MMDTKELWESALMEIELSVSKANFSTWFKNTRITKTDSGVVYLGVPNEFVKDWLINKYHTFILRALRNLSEKVRGLEYVVVKESDKPRNSPVFADTMGLSRELPLADLYVSKEDNLNPRYTFDSFVIGSFNELAYTASQAVIGKLGVVYNPLFIYGNTGLGKTHLIQAVGNTIKSKYPDKKVYYITSEKFSMDYINSLQNNKIQMFKEKYRKYDVIIMDDIQFLSRKEKTQEELFHLFNSLYDSNKQILFSSDRHPTYIPELEDRLRSRFAAGMIVDISLPEYESRLAILRAKSSQLGFPPDEDVLEYIASLVQGNIRELEGLLNSIICQAQLKGRNLALFEVKALIKNNIKPKKTTSIKEIVKLIADFYNIEEHTIYEKTRRKEVVKPRQIAMYILREDFNISFPSIGEKLGGRDHTTVIHSCEKIKGDLKVNNSLLQEIEEIRSMF